MHRNEAEIYYEDLYNIPSSPSFLAMRMSPMGPMSMIFCPCGRCHTIEASRDPQLVAFYLVGRCGQELHGLTFMLYLPRSYHEFDPEQVLPVVHTDYPLRPSGSPPGTGLFGHFSSLRPMKQIPKMFQPKKSRPMRN